jgi:hypothetical protein
MSEIDDWEIAISKAVMRLFQEVSALNPGASFADIDLTPVIEQSLEVAEAKDGGEQ